VLNVRAGRPVVVGAPVDAGGVVDPADSPSLPLQAVEYPTITSSTTSAGNGRFFGLITTRHDLPPVGPVPDPKLLSRQSDARIVLSRTGARRADVLVVHPCGDLTRPQQDVPTLGPVGLRQPGTPTWRSACRRFGAGSW
jgi:hypothetical protein